jgi:hypothetical protein
MHTFCALQHLGMDAKCLHQKTSTLGCPSTNLCVLVSELTENANLRIDKAALNEACRFTLAQWPLHEP